MYCGYSVTIDTYQRIADVVALIAEQEKIGFPEAYKRFSQTQAYKALANPQSLMWYETPGYIMDEYNLETK
jgi:hypothetical protein